MSLLKATPILAYLDQEKTINFYTKLGFECNANWDGYLMFKRDHINIHLWLCNDESIPKNTGCYVNVDEIDTLYMEYIDLQIVHPNGPLEIKPWGMKQFSILDNSGNIIHFGQDLT
jgi:hypothetical protein